jgi:uncharacterized protein (DUF4415 family)
VDNKFLTVVWTLRTGVIRIISAMSARHAEERAYHSLPAKVIDEMIRRGEDKSDWQTLDAITEAEIDHNAVDDVPENGFPDPEGRFWTGLPAPLGTGKKLMSVRIDNDVVDWFKSQGKGYQTRMNSVLRHYMEHHKDG